MRIHVPAMLAAALLAGGAASLCIELVQMLEPHRFPSPIDVVANSLGALAGAALCGLAARRLGASALVGRLSLELPLMGLIYLLVPLLWVGSLAIGENMLRLTMLALPVAFGAVLLGAMQRHHFGPGGAATPRGMALITAAAVALGTFPVLVVAPGAVAALCGLGAAVVLRHATLPAAGVERRFELPALRTAIPFLVIYLAAGALLPLLEPPIPLIADVEIRTVEILRLLHAAAAFTLLGYVIAELRGRLEQPLRTTFPRVLIASLPPAAATAAAAQFAPAGSSGMHAATLWLLLCTGGACYGAWLYHLQREHVRALVAGRRHAA